MEEGQDMDENLTCRVCLGEYNSQGNRPLLLPACGHTFCSFCVDLLHRQNKTSCPECRKPSAVQSVSSLPVNYGLLNMVQSRHTSANTSMAQTHPHAPSASPISPTRKTCNPFSLEARQSHVISATAGHTSDPSSSPVRGRYSLANLYKRGRHNSPPGGVPQPDTAADVSQIELAMEALQLDPPQPQSWHQPRLQTRHQPWNQPRLQTQTQHQPRLQPRHQRQQPQPWPQPQPLISPTQERTLKELQEELDFQMAIHLTFCKDESHGHDLHTCHSSGRWQFPADDDLSSVLFHTLQE